MPLISRKVRCCVFFFGLCQHGTFKTYIYAHICEGESLFLSSLTQLRLTLVEPPAWLWLWERWLGCQGWLSGCHGFPDSCWFPVCSCEERKGILSLSLSLTSYFLSLAHHSLCCSRFSAPLALSMPSSGYNLQSKILRCLSACPSFPSSDLFLSICMVSRDDCGNEHVNTCMTVCFRLYLCTLTCVCARADIRSWIRQACRALCSVLCTVFPFKSGRLAHVGSLGFSRCRLSLPWLAVLRSGGESSALIPPFAVCPAAPYPLTNRWMGRWPWLWYSLLTAAAHACNSHSCLRHTLVYRI